MGNVRKFLTVAFMALVMAVAAFGAVAIIKAVNDGASISIVAMAAENEEEADTTAVEAASEDEESSTGSKAIAAAIVVGAAAAVGAISMGLAISKSADGIARQPEAEGKIRSTLMLGLVFIETVVIYALIVAILIIFVL